MSCSDDEEDVLTNNLQLISLRVGDVNLQTDQITENVPVDRPIVASFSSALNTSAVETAINLVNESGDDIPLEFSFLDNNSAVSFRPEEGLNGNSSYRLEINDNLVGDQNETFLGISAEFVTETEPLAIESILVDEEELLGVERLLEVSLKPQILIKFDQQLDEQTITNSTIRVTIPSAGPVEKNIVLLEDGQTVQITFNESLQDMNRHNLIISGQVRGLNDQSLESRTFPFYTDFSDEFKFDEISNEELLTLVQEQTFRYFWDFAHPNSGLARERNTSGDLVTIGGSGFGMMAWIVGAERGFISRQEAVEQFDKAINFLAEADRFKGVWPHWLNGNTGQTIPFSDLDDGADLVETSFMIQALLTWKQYLNPSNAEEMELISLIDRLYDEVDWDWFTRGGQNILYWHWSENFDWQMNLPIRGWNECLITYILAAGANENAIERQVYDQGWANNGSMVNGNRYYDITLPLGESRGGPLFFSHYSFLGLDPRGLSDQYANYFEQNVAHTLINRAHAIENPLSYAGYGENLWGFTAGDNPDGYIAQSPNNDNGTIQPTAAISSFPYTPDESMQAIRTFYYLLGDRMWGEFGFYDGINVTRGWVASSYLAIDQGPIILMIENHRSGLLWELFMQNPEVDQAFNKLGITKNQ